MPEIKLFKTYKWDNDTITFGKVEMNLSTFLKLIETLNEHRALPNAFKIDNIPFKVSMRESKICDFYYEINGIEFISSDINLVYLLVKNSVDITNVKEFVFEKCNWFVTEDFLFVYDKDYTRFGLWNISEVLAINPYMDGIKELKMGNFVDNALKYPEEPKLKNICNLGGQGISMGFYKKRFIEFKEQISLNRPV
jgi:hypothetical protein